MGLKYQKVGNFDILVPETEKRSNVKTIQGKTTCRGSYAAQFVALAPLSFSQTSMSKSSNFRFLKLQK